MARSAKQPNKAVQSLLDEKRQIEQWLDRLSMAADKTPEGVRTKVERDYRVRLEKVLGELEGHRGEMQKTVERRRGLRTELVAREKQTSEELSEAELRHAVGEYSESEWTKVRSDILESLVQIREEIKAADEEIASLQEVLSSVAAGETATETADEEEVPFLEHDDEDEEEDEGEPEAATAQAKSPAHQTDAFDELAFLKSVTEDEEHGPRPERASGQMEAIGDEPPATEAESEPSGAAAGKDSGKKKKKKKEKEKASVGAGGVTPVESAPEPTKGTSRRTLRCAECGTMNLPTEWYCEKCGAELAAL